MTLRELIIKSRTESNMTQGELAEKSGIPQSRISEFESGRRSMNSDNVDRLIQALGVNINQYESRYLIIYKDMDLNTKSGKIRTENLLKGLFWKEQVPDWEGFDGELSVIDHAAFGIRDAAVVVFNSKSLEEYMLSKLQRLPEIFKIEKQ